MGLDSSVRPGDSSPKPLPQMKVHRLGRMAGVALLRRPGARGMSQVWKTKTQVPRSEGGKLAQMREVPWLRPQSSCGGFSTRIPPGSFSWNTLRAQPPTPPRFDHKGLLGPPPGSLPQSAPGKLPSCPPPAKELLTSLARCFPRPFGFPSRKHHLAVTFIICIIRTRIY